MNTSPDQLMPESIQTKADILESNLFLDLKKSNNNTYAELIFNRKDTLNVVVEKAVLQLLFRFNIYPAILEESFGNALKNDFSETDSDIIELSYPIDDTITGMEGVRNLYIRVRKQDIFISIKGTTPILQKNEVITRYYFDHQEYPGKLLPNGKFDFRELHKFPAVKKGDKLLFVRYPVTGKNGIAFDGSVISVSDPTYLDLQLQQGVHKHEIVNKNDQPVGYYVIADKTGVVIMKMVEGQIRDIDVNDVIELETIDYSIGNIGSEFVSPVSMKIGTINAGFKVRAKGIVEVQNLDGGEVYTDKEALIDQVRSDAKVTAESNIEVRTVSDSVLTSLNGIIQVKSEIRDSEIIGPKLTFISQKGMMLNNKFDICELELQNVYYCGTNDFYLGKNLFKQRLLLIDEIEKLDKGFSDIQSAIDSIKIKLVEDLKKLGSQITDDNIKNMFKLLIQTLLSFTFSDSFKILDNLRTKLNVTQIDNVKKSFEGLQKLSDTILEYKNKKTELNDKFASINHSLNRIRFTLSGVINPTATIRIFCSLKSMEDPAHEIKPTNKRENESISISGRYNMKEGFIIN